MHPQILPLCPWENFYFGEKAEEPQKKGNCKTPYVTCNLCTGFVCFHMSIFFTTISSSANLIYIFLALLFLPCAAGSKANLLYLAKFHSELNLTL